MADKKDFEIGDLVWAKMKRYPYWPAKIVEPPTDVKPANPKKVQHFVFFFGSENHAWIPDESIMHHSDEMLKSVPKKKSASLKLAIEKISEESSLAPKKANSPIDKEKESPPKSPELSISTGKIIKDRKPKVQKKNTPQKHVLEDSGNEETSPARKLPKKSDDHSALVDNSPPAPGQVRVAVIKPLPEGGEGNSTGFNRRNYFDLPADTPLDLEGAHENIQNKSVVPTKSKIGFIGLGMMGQRFVKNLLAKKHDVTVWNRTPEKCKDFIKVGAQFAQTPADVIEKCDIIFCCVSGPDASKSLVFGNCGILSGLEKCTPGTKGYVEMTTIDPTTSIEIAEAIVHKGGKYLEAMISGSKTKAEEGNVLVLAAGDRELFLNCETCFSVLSKHAYYLSSEVGSGSKMNLINSMLMGVSIAALGEAMALVERCKLSQANLLELLTFEPFNSNLLIEKGKAIMEKDFSIETSLKYQQKDLSLALTLANKCEQPMLVTAAANEVFKHAKLRRYADHDVSAVYFGAKY